MLEITELKAVISAILFALGRITTKQEFNDLYYKVEGESFAEILNRWQLSFFEFMTQIPDVCCLFYNSDGVLFLQRISNARTAHLDHLTIVPRR